MKKRHQNQQDRGRGAEGATRRRSSWTVKEARGHITSQALTVSAIKSAAGNPDRDQAIIEVQRLLPEHFPEVRALPLTKEGLRADLVIAQNIVALVNASPSGR